MAPQEQLGMEIIGMFRDLEDEQRFVWIRSFPSMARRASSLDAFYGGPVWRRHRDAANATMIDSDNVLLLRPAWRGSSFNLERRARSSAADRGVVQLGIVSFHNPVDDAALRYFSDELKPLFEPARAKLLACLISEPAPNTFPALPVREAENVLVWLAGFPDGSSAAQQNACSLHCAASSCPGIAAAPEIRILAPTDRSRLTGSRDQGCLALRGANSSI
jgi:hypothetical protein